MEWKPVVYADVRPGMYEVSNFGQIRNVITKNIMSTCLSEKGYPMVDLMTIHGKSKCKKLHRIVAKHFVPGETSEKCEVDHVDSNKKNNKASNLEWVTHLENIRRAYKNKLVPIKYCEDHPLASLTNEEVHEICRLLVENEGVCFTVYEMVKDHIDCSIRVIHRIKYKKSYCTISDLYFTTADFPKFKKAQRLSKLT